MASSPKPARPAPGPAPPTGPVICEKGRHENCLHTRRKPSAAGSR